MAVVRPCLAAAGCTLLLLGSGPAGAAEGPGYRGSADGLSVTWAQAEQELQAMAAEGDIQLQGSALSLEVFGLGFRGKSEVVVSVGTSDPVDVRVDETGTLELSVGVAELTGGPQPGTSVVVAGRAPSGTSRTLVGAVPPLPSGFGPADVVPWAVLGAAATAGWLRWRRSRRG